MKYVVTFELFDETEIGLLFEIEETINRPNDPDNETLIFDYLYKNYGNVLNPHTIKWHVLNDIVYIGEDYCVEI
ncbi:hypothetical protein SAMN04487895_101500 [Paenibacillus sophorae]|uniref:Uncharacterized protein n=1 Tax=Paenibacillus sophorae TaxID=1333845 RepID=A0A1H8GGH8_9BACL|nr:hypothetical protein [Paenibacillus sophorae]QWU14211.1 hypothetical protein KP014_20070 [Paenibacillus sophorae]SEN42880.1 hypothetical protein SAMN04487895_101500 [Paenibacillus sophorae]